MNGPHDVGGMRSASVPSQSRVSHTTLSRYFARPDVAKQLKRADQLNRAEKRAAEARWQAEQKAEREAHRVVVHPVANRRVRASRYRARRSQRPSRFVMVPKGQEPCEPADFGLGCWAPWVVRAL